MISPSSGPIPPVLFISSSTPQHSVCLPAGPVFGPHQEFSLILGTLGSQSRRRTTSCLLLGISSPLYTHTHTYTHTQTHIHTCIHTLIPTHKHNTPSLSLLFSPSFSLSLSLSLEPCTRSTGDKFLGPLTDARQTTHSHTFLCCWECTTPSFFENSSHFLSLSQSTHGTRCAQQMTSSLDRSSTCLVSITARHPPSSACMSRCTCAQGHSKSMILPPIRPLLRRDGGNSNTQTSSVR